MDILQRELNEVYARQRLEEEALDAEVVEDAVAYAKIIAKTTGICCVVTDIAADCSYFAPGVSAGMLGLSENEQKIETINSADEDFLYTRITPMDLAELRMLEYEFFKQVELSQHKLDYKAVGYIRMAGREGAEYRVAKSTQVLTLSPKGKMWLILCCYDFAPSIPDMAGIRPTIFDMATGTQVTFNDFADRRGDILSTREKQVLRLIAEGKLSKEIASELTISINTVNRHRQNIREKLSVNNAIEAVRAARAMGLV